MSLELADDAVKLFEAEVHQVFQPMVEDIRTRVRVKNAKGAKIVHFPVLGKTKTSERTNFHTDIPVGNTAHDPVTVTVKNWTASEYTDIFLNNQVNYDERQELAKSISLALQRRLLQLVINALGAASISKTIAKNISGSNDNLNLTMLRVAAKKLGLDGVPKEGRTWMAHVNNLHYLTKDSQVTSSDFNTVKILTKGEIDTYYGFSFYEVADMADETDGATAGGLPLSTNDRTNYAFQKMAVGLAVNMEPKIEVFYDGNKGAHRVTGFMSANAVVIDKSGCVQITCDESVN